MVVLQISLSEKQYSYAKKMLVQAQGSFQVVGIKFTLGKTLMKILEEWSRNRGFIKETKGERDNNLALSMFKNNPERVSVALDLIQKIERGKDYTQETLTNLMDLIRELESTWTIPRGEGAPNLNEALVVKMKELLSGDVIEIEREE